MELSISAVIPTRGDVDTGKIVRHLRTYPEINTVDVIVGTTPFNRFRGAERAKCDVIYTQDDDVLTDLRPLIDAYSPGIIVNAMRELHAHRYLGAVTLIGYGAIFDRAMIRCLDGWERDALFLRECDRVFTALNPHRTVFPSVEVLPHATATDRLSMQSGHFEARDEIYRRILQRTGIAA